MSITMTGRLTLDDNTIRDFRQVIMNAWLAEINKSVSSKLRGSVARIKEAVTTALLDAPEIKKIAGEYKGEWGMIQPMDQWRALCAVLADSIDARQTAFAYNGRTISGSILIVGLPIDNKAILAMPESVVMDQKTGKVFYWLDALLNQGDAIVVDHWRYLSDVISEEDRQRYSRTGLGFMVPSNDRGWRVPSDISGNISDNVITRALQTLQPTIEKELISLLG